jgi:Xaa-Pro aminopeptidase
MASGKERIERIKQALSQEFLDALVCTLPTNVLMLSGYWPVVGTAVVVATADGRVAVLAPKDEHELAHEGWADDVRTYSPSSLEHPTTVQEAIHLPLRTLLEEKGLSSARIGYEDGGIYEASSYAAMYQFQAGIKDVLEQATQQVQLTSAMGALMRLRSTLTAEEVDQVRQACTLVGQAFGVLAEQLRPGLTEPEVAVALAAPILVGGHTRTGGRRAGAFTWCMSGPNSAEAKGAFARSRDRALQRGDFVLVHCNSYQEGYWTDITRTFCLGAPDDRKRAMYGAVFAARSAALSTIRPGVAAADVDGAARVVLSDRGFGQYFPHPVGHNVGFSVISAEFPPRLRPKSPDHLEVGMTFNIEPAIYIDGYGGLRHCDVVTVREDGPEVLTPFLSSVEELVVGK